MTYDEITNHFTLQLSPLARQLYAAIFDACATPGRTAYISAWHLAEHHPQFAGLDAHIGSAADEAKRELLQNGLIQEVPNLGCRYQPTAQAWAYHYQAAVARATPAPPPPDPASEGSLLDGAVADEVVPAERDDSAPPAPGSASTDERTGPGPFPLERYTFIVEGCIEYDGLGMFGNKTYVEQRVVTAEPDAEGAIAAALDLLNYRYPAATWDTSEEAPSATLVHELTEAEVLHRLGPQIAPRLPGFDDTGLAAAGEAAAAA